LRRSKSASRFGNPRDPASPRDTPDIRFAFSVNETKPPHFVFCFFFVSHFLSTHLAELLSAGRRSLDDIETEAVRRSANGVKLQAIRRPKGRLSLDIFCRDRIYRRPNNPPIMPPNSPPPPR
jgi:hypothetical protein